MTVLAYDYPLLSLFFSMLWFFLFFAWIMCLFYVFVDIFRSHDMSGVAKTLWVLFVIIVPLLGVLIYLIARGSKMHEHAARDAAAQDAAFRSYVADAAANSGPGDQLAKLAALRDSGAITEAEFQAGKQKILA